MKIKSFYYSQMHNCEFGVTPKQRKEKRSSKMKLISQRRKEDDSISSD
jgi:hypothetical protein